MGTTGVTTRPNAQQRSATTPRSAGTTPQSSAGVTAPPPTEPQKSATTPSQDCPLAVTKPCDVDLLQVKVTGVADDKSSSKALSPLQTRAVRRREPVSDVKDKNAVRLLQQYDLLIDVLAEPNAPATPGAKPAIVEVKADYHGRHCATQSHALVLIEDLYAHETHVEKKPGAPSLTIAARKYYPVPSFVDKAGGKEPFDSLTSVFGIVKALWDQTAERGIGIDAQSCGIRARGDGRAKNVQLRALVRVYRKSKWAFGLSIPPLGSFEDKKAGSLDVRGVTTRSDSSSLSAGFNLYRNEVQSTRSGEGTLGAYSFSQNKQLGGTVSSYDRSRKVEDGTVTETFREQYSGADGRKIVNQDGSFTTEEIKKRLERATGFELVVSYNDTEVELGKALEKIKKQINRIVEVIRNVRKLFDALPQIGWSFRFDVSVFAGKVALEWSSKYGKAPLAAGRYLPVVYELSGRIDIELVKLTLKVSFGADLRVLGTGMVAMIEGSITLKAEIGADVKLGASKLVDEIDVAASGLAKLSAIASASVLGLTLVDAELSVSGGIQLKGAKLTLSWSLKKFDLKGRLVSKKIELTGYLRRKWLWDKKIDPPKLILEEKLLHEFT